VERIGELERKYVSEVLDEQFRTSSAGKWVRRFEDAFCEKIGAKYGVALCNGTATLHTALLALGVGPGDEVITSPLTMASPSFAILYCGAKPVFADINPDTWCIDPHDIERKITPKTKGLLVIHLFGMPCDMDAIMDIARRHNLFVLEDAAQAVGATYKGKHVGTIGNAGSFSFQSSKHLTAGEGGILVTDDEELARKFRQISGLGYASLSAGQNRITKDDIQKPDAIRHTEVGYNYRPTDLACAVLLAQTERMEKLVEYRQWVAVAYHYGCWTERSTTKDGRCGVAPPSWLEPQFRRDYSIAGSYWTFAFLLKENAPCTWEQFRERFISFYGDSFYGAWRLTYREPVFERMGYPQTGLCPVAEKVQPRLVCLKTNYFDRDEVWQALALTKTILSFGG
jgi:perosamine synthetase